MNRCTDWQKLASLGPEMRILPTTKVNECNRDIASTMRGPCASLCTLASLTTPIFFAAPVEQEYNPGRRFSRLPEEHLHHGMQHPLRREHRYFCSNHAVQPELCFMAAIMRRISNPGFAVQHQSRIAHDTRVQ